MQTEDDSLSSLDDLFDDGEPPAATPHTYECLKCGRQVSSPEPLKFCATCGTALSAGGEDSSEIHVLLVEDSAMSRRKISTILRALDCRVTEAEDGYEALRLVEEARPDLVILDVHMPMKSGIEVLAELREKYSAQDLPVVMLTAEADIEVVRQAVKSGADDYIRKDAGTTDVRDRLNGQIQRLRSK